MTGKLVFDIFVSACERNLSAGETKMLRLFCGMDTGYPPMGIAQLAPRLNRSPEQTKQLIRRALEKLPQYELKQLYNYLTTPDHRFHVGLTPAQRNAMLTLIEQGLQRQAGKRLFEMTAVKQAPPEPISVQPPKPAHVSPSKPADVLRHVLETRNQPTHYTTLASLTREHGLEVSEHEALNALSTYSAFVLVGQGVFALADWHNRIMRDGLPVLRYCPPLPIEPKAPSESFFDLLMHIYQWTHESLLTYTDIWRRAARYSGVGTNYQDLYNLLYAVGFIDNANFDHMRNGTVTLALPQHVEVRQVRHHALESVLTHVDALPRVLGALEHLYRPEMNDIAAFVYGDALHAGDLPQRLRLLEALGAIQQRGGWQVTDSGLQALARYPQAMHPLGGVVVHAPLPKALEDDLDWLDL